VNLLLRLVQRALSWYLGGSGRSWLLTTAIAMLFRLVRANVGRRELIDVSDIKPGEMIVIELLPESHNQQLKQEKKDRRSARRLRRLGRKKA